MSRLPTPGSDDNVWGSILNDYLGVSIASDGTLKSGVVGTTQIASGAVTSASIADGTITTTDISSTAGITKAQLATAVQTSLSSADGAATAGANSNITSLSGLTTALSIAQGGTGSTTQNFVDLSSAQTVAGVKTFSAAPTLNAGATMNATNIVTDATTGLKIGTATTQKVGFLGSTPIAQMANSSDLGTVLSSFGFRASGGTYSLQTNSTVTFSASVFTLGSSMVLSPATRTAAFSMTNTSAWMNYVNSSTAFTITLQTSPTNGINFIFKNTGTAAVTIAAGSGQTIDGASTFIIYANDEVWVQSVSSTTWGIIDYYTPNLTTSYNYQTLTNKTMNLAAGNGNTLTNLPLSTAVTGTLPVANGGTGTTTSTGTGNVVLSTSPTLTTPVIASITNTGTLTLPTSTDTLVGRATADTLTNKTISGASNTLSNIPESAVTNLTTDLSSKLTITSGTSKITVGTTAPSSPAVGDLWVDTN